MDKFLLLYMLRHVHGIGNICLLHLLNDTMHWSEKEWNLSSIIQKLHVTDEQRYCIQSQLNEMCHHLHFWQNKKDNDPFILLTDEQYPMILSQIYNPPAMLFYRGDLSLLKKDALAVIGSRKAIYDSYRAVDHFIPSLVPHFVMVSGLALGIDSYAHIQTLKHHGHAIAVVGNGLDYFYPKENTALQNQIATHHLMISEYPSGTSPRPYYFPQRNRIIAGLSNGVCVFQARKKSGTFITANLALEEGRAVYAIPGSILSPHFEGCHRLIQMGAKLVFQPQHIIEEKWLFQYQR